jgi:membrane protease YdiL (CAAX protease family)
MRWLEAVQWRAASAGTVLRRGAVLLLGAVVCWLATPALRPAAALTPFTPLTPLWLSLLWAPALEEVLFRLGLQESLLRRGCRPALTSALVALAFALAHLGLRGLSWPNAATFVPALGLGLLYARTRRVSDCILAHAACNAWWWLASTVPTVSRTTPWPT